MLNKVEITGPTTRSVSSVTFAITGTGAYDRAVHIAVNWMRGLNPAIGVMASEGLPFEVGGGGDYPARAVVLEYDEGVIWSATIDNPDKNVVGRTWITEITIAMRKSEVHFGSRLLNVTRQELVPFIPSIPRLVCDIIGELHCIADRETLSEYPRYIENNDDLEQFLVLLEAPYRRLPVIVMAQAISRSGATNLETLARRLAGSAHVYGLMEEQAWELTRRVGRQMSVFDGAVRLYRPKLKLDDADPFDHPLWLPTLTATASSISARVTSRVLDSGVSKGTTDYPRFEAVRQAVVERNIAARRANSSDAVMLQLYEDEISTLRQQLDALRSEQNQWLSDAESERSAAERHVTELKAETHSYRSQNQLLRSRLQGSGAVKQREPLTDYTNFREWAERNISPNVWFAPKAIKEIERNSVYRSPDDIGEALVILDEIYVPMKRDLESTLHQKWQEELNRFSLISTSCFSKEGDIQRFPEYKVVYRGDVFWCDQHIKYGGGTDPRSMFRIYFTWHSDENIVIVGHLPTHLDNNLTN